ncbi:hypothetical protein ACOSQ2_022074 [Xanthoceras sorbifolium]
MGTNVVESISLDLSQIRELQLSPNAFMNTSRLKFLKFYNPEYHESYSVQDKVHLFQGLELLPKELKSLPSNFNPDCLVELEMPHSNIEHFWTKNQPLENLRGTDHSYSQRLIEAPIVSEVTNCGVHAEEDVKSTKSHNGIDRSSDQAECVESKRDVESTKSRNDIDSFGDQAERVVSKREVESTKSHDNIDISGDQADHNNINGFGDQVESVESERDMESTKSRNDIIDSSSNQAERVKSGRDGISEDKEEDPNSKPKLEEPKVEKHCKCLLCNCFSFLFQRWN